jgi:hypothetical protein
MEDPGVAMAKWGGVNQSQQAPFHELSGAQLAYELGSETVR